MAKRQEEFKIRGAHQASDSPLRRRIGADTGCALLINPLDPDAIAGATDHLLSHPEEAEEMGKRGLRVVEQKYNWEREKKKRS
ncbi:glycosyltransferase family protein [Thermus caliditerrae]|uniref:glycosyltransferase family protein n=1 Tax=Thermus caliditerrae TaxID=1330700 RepID=UPI001F42473F|nr:glycosyltransferase [Thermus caliditerrae]